MSDGDADGEAGSAAWERLGLGDKRWPFVSRYDTRAIRKYRRRYNQRRDQGPYHLDPPQQPLVKVMKQHRLVQACDAAAGGAAAQLQFTRPNGQMFQLSVRRVRNGAVRVAVQKQTRRCRRRFARGYLLCTHARTHARTHACTHARTHARATHACKYACARVRSYLLYMSEKGRIVGVPETEPVAEMEIAPADMYRVVHLHPAPATLQATC